MRKGSNKKPTKAASDLDPDERQLFLDAFYYGETGYAYKGEEMRALPSRISSKKRMHKRGMPDARLDLHGLHADEAYFAIRDFISQQLARGNKTLLIIHGKGGGVLRETVLSIINSHAEVVDYQVAPAKLGGTGAIIIKISHKFRGRRNF
jgi:DNA-nicking Smr family endonuclease